MERTLKNRAKGPASVTRKSQGIRPLLLFIQRVGKKSE